MSERFEIDVFTWVLMGNHYHLLLRTNRANLSKSMLWEDLRHGMIIGSKKFVDKILSAYLPEKSDKEIPQQRDSGKGIDPVAKLIKAARTLDCDLDHFRRVWYDVFLGQPYRKVYKADNGAGQSFKRKFRSY